MYAMMGIGEEIDHSVENNNNNVGINHIINDVMSQLVCNCQCIIIIIKILMIHPICAVVWEFNSNSIADSQINNINTNNVKEDVEVAICTQFPMYHHLRAAHAPENIRKPHQARYLQVNCLDFLPQSWVLATLRRFVSCCCDYLEHKP